MNPIRIAGVVGVAVGAVLLGFAYHASNAPVDQLANTLTGRFTDRTMWYLVTGAGVAVGGVLLAIAGGRR